MPQRFQSALRTLGRQALPGGFLMSHAVVPARSERQRMLALERANEVRLHRARVKRQLRAGRVSLADVLEDELWASAKVIDVLLALPKCGRVKAYQALSRAGISPSKSVGGMTARQRRALWEALGRFPALREVAVAS